MRNVAASTKHQANIAAAAYRRKNNGGGEIKRHKHRAGAQHNESEKHGV